MGAHSTPFSRWVHRTGAAALTGLAAALVGLALLAPADTLSAGAFLRVPLELPVALATAVLLPARVRRAAALAVGAALGLLAVVKALDLGFGAVQHRRFDLLLDWPLLGPAIGYVDTTAGRTAATLAGAGVCAAAVALVVGTAFAAGRLAGVAARRRSGSLRAAAALAVVWLVAAVPGVRNPAGLPVAATPAASVAVEHAQQVRTGLGDPERFAAEAAADPFAGVPADRLLAGLRGTDVVVVFLESYGRVAVEHPEIAPRVGAALDAGTRRLAGVGYAARTGYLASPTTGGGSWLAHATLLSGLWVDNQQRYNALVARERLTLPSAFAAAGWQSVGIMPGITRDWPEGAFFGYDRVYPADGMGYRGPAFGFASMPDQYALSFLERVRRATGPVLAVVPVLSSHAPWTPLPDPVPWPSVGDGSVFAGMRHGDGMPQAIWNRPAADVRADYARSLEYSVATLVSYLDSHAEGDLVVVVVGDHQPASMVTGGSRNRDAPATVIARDPTVLQRVAEWGWTPGLRPGPGTPTWRMDAFRDRFLTAFG